VSEGGGETPVDIVGIERKRFLKRRDRFLMPTFPDQDMTEVAVRRRQAWIELHGLACECECRVERVGIERAVIERKDKGRHVRVSEERIGTPIVRIGAKRLVEEAPRLIEFLDTEG